MAKYVSDIRKTAFRRGIVALFATVALMCAPSLALADDSQPLGKNPDQFLDAVALEGDSPISTEVDADESGAQNDPTVGNETSSDTGEAQTGESASNPPAAQDDGSGNDTGAEAVVKDDPTNPDESLPTASEQTDATDNAQADENESFIEGLRESDAISGSYYEGATDVSDQLIAGKGSGELGYELEDTALPGLEGAAISESENTAADNDVADNTAPVADPGPTEPSAPLADAAASDDDAIEKATDPEAADPDAATPNGKVKSKSKHSVKQPFRPEQKRVVPEAGPTPVQPAMQSAPVPTCADSANCKSENENGPADAPAEPSQPPATPAPAPAEPNAPAGPTSSITNLLRTISSAHHNSAAALALGAISLGGPRVGSAASLDENGKVQPPCQGRIRCRSPSIA